MFRNYLKIAFRSLRKSKGFTAINVIGLSSGLAVCLLIVLYVTDELGYDRYNVNADRIYRLDADIFYNHTGYLGADGPKPLAPSLIHDNPQFEQFVRLSYAGDVMVRKGNNYVQEHHYVFADSTFFKVFTVRMLAGDPNTALNEPNSLVIDESTARKYFDGSNAPGNVVGKSLELENHTICKITGVFQDMPRQSHFHFSLIRPMREAGIGDYWLGQNCISYILARPGYSSSFLQSRVNVTVNTYIGKAMQTELHQSMQDMDRQGAHIRYLLMPLRDIHLHSNKIAEFEPNGNIVYVYVFLFIAILILAIACVNFMNLSTARSANRAKEVGIRKVAGSTKGHLIFQFLTESVLLSFFSGLLAMGIAVALLPMFNQLSGKQLDAGMLYSSRILPLMVGLVLTVGFLAGSYPAFYLSSFRPILVLKGKIAAGFKASWLRSSLVVFQFFISIGLIIGTLVIYRQLTYIRNRDIGFNRDQVLVVQNAYLAGDAVRPFRQDLLKLSGVVDATLTNNLPTNPGNYSQNAWYRERNMAPGNMVLLTNLFVDEHYIPTLGMHMVTGRNFTPAEYRADSMGIILNEAAAQMLGFKDPLNQKLYVPGAKDSTGAYKLDEYHVIGVVKDFNFTSMHEKVQPMIMNLADNRGSLSIRFQGGVIPALVQEVEAGWRRIANGAPFSYTFLDNDFNNIYKSESQTGRLFVTFAVFAILIACLGLFGLVTYAAEQRMKEIGIRKVLGANVGGIVALLSRDFLQLVGIAAIIAFPVAWWAMNQWLRSFAYRTGISWWIFAAAAAAAILIALVTVSFQTIRAALANPVKSLRSE
ncbi:ABC transporter permease [Puia dinghuensis]|uniref:ABC transporter permease n=1 Tax=Puia dinghuensis TaxID=1792502 RepID=A0A8J2UCP4_9BACT|nr:ABC transporter permease [Puia dinghuensis]GGA96315.1 ABC transporter permease [Puia dinghuensis]